MIRTRRRKCFGALGGMRRLIAVDLFSGCGGLTSGLKRAGFSVIGAVDNHSLAVETYRRNHPEVVVWNADIRELETEQFCNTLGLRQGQLDLLAGCPPCQGFSAMRTLNGHRTVNDPRNDLVFDFLRFVCDLRPKAVMMENVPGLATDYRMDILIDRLRALGYANARYAVLDTADYGVPQRRRRTIVVATRRGRVNLAPLYPQRKTVRHAIGHLPVPGMTGDALHDAPETRTPQVLELIRNIPKDGGSRNDLGPEHQLRCHQKCDGFKDVYGRMAWDRPSPTITTGCFNPSKGRFIHPEQDRAITLREAALLQTFSPLYFFSMRAGKTGAAALIGNALPPDFIKRHAYQIRRVLKGCTT